MIDTALAKEEAAGEELWVRHKAKTSMSELFIESFVDKLILLEKRTGATVQYHPIPPLQTQFFDEVSLQRTAKYLASFIGLTGYTFIVTFAKLKEGVAGHIDLSSKGTSIHIEIDLDLKRLPNIPGATLCHELCHKWLQHNGIQIALERDHEILTDITSVYLGFGKIMLNGCKAVIERNATTASGTQTIVETRSAGYLDRDQLSLVYNLICAMRRVPETEYMAGLNPEARVAVQECSRYNGHHYSPYFHESGAAQPNVDRFESDLNQAQHVMANLDKHLTYVEASFCKTVHCFLKAGHPKLESLHQNAVASARESSPDPALRFLLAIKAKSEIERLNERISSISQEADSLLRHARKIGRHLSSTGKLFPPPSSTMFNIVTCPKDGTKLRLPENSNNLIAKCPVCKYSFAYNTRVISFIEQSAPSEKSARQDSSWWQKALSFLRRKKLPDKSRQTQQA